MVGKKNIVFLCQENGTKYFFSITAGARGTELAPPL